MAVTTLAAAIATTGATSCTVRDVADFPVSGTFHVVVDSEKILVSAGAGTTSWTIARGQDGTSPATHALGANVWLVPAHYATLTELIDLAAPLPTGETHNARLLTACLVRASSVIDARCARQFYRIPATGTETRTYDGTGLNRIVIPEGIVSLTAVKIADYTGATAETCAATDWYLRASLASKRPDPGDSYYVVILSDQGDYGTFPKGFDTAELTGVFGYDPEPPVITAGALHLARQMLYAVPSASGDALAGIDGAGIPIPAYLPRQTYEAIEWGRSRTSWDAT